MSNKDTNLLYFFESSLSAPETKFKICALG